MERLCRALAWLERRVNRRGALVLFLLALAVYGLQSLALPLVAGRDLGTYLRYYAQFGDASPPLPMAMLFRTPVAPFAVGVPLDLGGAALAQVWLGLLYAASIVAWSATAAVFGARSALLTAALLLVFPGYGILFHALASDAVFAAVFAGWALVVSRATVRRSVPLFVAAGLLVGALALTRPGNQVLLLFALFPLVLHASWRWRLSAAAGFLVAGVCVLALWAVHNGVRYGDYAVVRGSAAFIPFFRMYVSDHIVSPENGPASRKLARAVDRELLPLEPYRSYGVDEDTFFRRGSIRMHEDLVNLSDRVWGWDSSYSVLRRAAWEALRAHAGTYAQGVTRTIWQELARPEFAVSSAQAGSARPAKATGSGLPSTEGEPIPAAHWGLYTTTRDRSVDERWTSPTAHELVFRDPADARRYAEIEGEIGGWLRDLPAYDTNATLRTWLNRASRWYPRPWMWLVLAIGALAWRRPRWTRLALALSAAAVAVVAFTALGIFTVVEFALPVVPAFVVAAAAGLVGVRPREELV